MSFEKDLEQGKKAERLVAEKLNAVLGFDVFKVTAGYLKEYDILGLIEVKDEPNADPDKYGDKASFFIETNYKGKQSGIRASRSHYWALSNKKYIYFIKRSTILELIEFEKLDHRVSESSSTEGYLLTVLMLKEYADAIYDRQKNARIGTQTIA